MLHKDDTLHKGSRLHDTESGTMRFYRRVVSL